MSSSPTLPAQTPSPSPLDFSGIEGHLEHAWDDVKGYVNNMTSGQTEKNAEQMIQNDETQRAGEKQYSDYIYKNNPQEYRQANPVDYIERKAHDALSNVITQPLLKGRTPQEKAVLEPGYQEVVDAGTGAYGVPQGGEGLGTTPAPKQGIILPEGGELAEAEPELDFSSVEGHQEHPELSQGGHAGGGVASVEELNRPGRFVKVSRSGQLTDQGKVPDFNLKPGEAGYQVTHNGYELKAGQETPATKMGVDKYHKEVFKKSVPEAGAEGTKLSVKDIQGPPIEKEGMAQNARKILRDPAADDRDKAIATSQLEHHHATRFEDNEPIQPKSPQQTVEAAGGTYKGESKDGLVEITLPRKMTEHLPISDRFKDFVSVTMPKGKINPDSVRAAMTKKFSDMGGDPTMLSKALAKD